MRLGGKKYHQTGFPGIREMGTAVVWKIKMKLEAKREWKSGGGTRGDIKHTMSQSSGHSREIMCDFLRVVVQAKWGAESERGQSPAVCPALDMESPLIVSDCGEVTGWQEQRGH